MTPDCCEQDRVWKIIKMNDKTHMICVMKENKTWKVLLTNLIEIWMEILTDETMFYKCQTLNPLLNFEAFDWKQLIMDMLNDIPQHVHTCTAEVSTYRIELRIDKDFIKLKVLLDLLKGTPQQFWENVTMPFCLSSMELIRQHEILLDLVRRKDEEIAEYKAEGAELIRKYIATKPFNEELFHIDTSTLTSIDFIKTFQSVLHFYNKMNLPESHKKMESEISSSNTSDNNATEIDENDLSDSFKNEFIHKPKQIRTSKGEQSKVKECECEASSSSKVPVLKISSTSHSIHKLKKNKKTLSDFIL